VNIEVKLWSEMPETTIEDLFLNNPFPLYRGTPLASDLMKKYIFTLARDSALHNDKNAIVALVDNKPIVTGQVLKVPYLSTYWGQSIGSLCHLVTDNPNEEKTFHAARILIEHLLEQAKKDKVAFVSVTVPASSIMIVRALEKNFFFNAEGFINMVGPTNTFRATFTVPGLRIRDIVDKDFIEIAEAYHKMPFPTRYVNDGGFDKKKAVDLYLHRFREVYEQKLGKIFVAEIEGQFAGALIAIIDEQMRRTIGVKTNPLTGMGIIVHPRASRRGVSLALIEHRQEYYKSQGVHYVNFNANYNNVPMLRGLAKLGLEYGSLDITFHQWI